MSTRGEARVLGGYVAIRTATLFRVGLESNGRSHCQPNRRRIYVPIGSPAGTAQGRTTTRRDHGRTQTATVLCRGACRVHHSIYILLTVPPSLVGLAAVLAVIRANKEDLPDIVRALMRVRARDDKRDDDSGKGPPSLPKP
jgi:hypothetical protein